ncbi:hypothetical protein Goarm_013470, partial [Gossypium armourianum]|nr:hypothetical protein [Gossypium armourianum]
PHIPVIIWQSEVEELNFRRDDDDDGDEAEAKSENGSRCGGIGVEELVKELKAIKTSLLFQIKNGFTNPFKSVGSRLVTLLKGRAKPTQQHCNHLVNASGSPSSLQLSEFLHLGSSGEGH